MTAPLACAASTLVADVLERRSRWLEAVRTPVSVHYETGDPAVPVVCVGTPAAVRMPHGVVVEHLPDEPAGFAVRRWWRPPRPTALSVPAHGRWAAWVGRTHDAIAPHRLVGSGTGLTPDGDDLLAGVLVAAAALDDPRSGGWRRATRAALATRRTTAVSVGMLHSALGGWATPELDAALRALCSDADPAPEVLRLLALGHSSGRALLDGVLHVVTTHPSRSRGAAA